MNMIDVYAQKLSTYASIMSADLNKADLEECLEEIKEIVGKLEKKVKEVA